MFLRYSYTIIRYFKNIFCHTIILSCIHRYLNFSTRIIVTYRIITQVIYKLLKHLLISSNFNITSCNINNNTVLLCTYLKHLHR